MGMGAYPLCKSWSYLHAVIETDILEWSIIPLDCDHDVSARFASLTLANMQIILQFIDVRLVHVYVSLPPCIHHVTQPHYKQAGCRYIHTTCHFVRMNLWAWWLEARAMFLTSLLPRWKKEMALEHLGTSIRTSGRRFLGRKVPIQCFMRRAPSLRP